MTPPPPEEAPYAPEALPRRPEVGAQAFSALDLRIGRISAVEAFPEARKPMWRLTVDFGPVVGTLQTGAQITNYSREELLGRRVVGALNLGTRKIAGFVSEFLVLGGLAPDGTVHLLEVSEALEPGAPVA